MIEITEKKLDTMLEHVEKGIRCLTKLAEYIESIKDDDYEDDDEEYERRKSVKKNRTKGVTGRYNDF